MNDEDEDYNIQDDAGKDETGSVTYAISWYGADYTVDGLVKRLDNKSFYVPSFQRDFVWTKRQASRFVESLLLGLPVPGIFVAKDPENARHMVIDGQQRLKTLDYFYADRFPGGDGHFRLIDVDSRWMGKTVKELAFDDKQRLDDSIIHTTVFKQDSPDDEATSIYHVFERLNTGGTKLTPQEVRSAIDAGPFVDLLSSLNQNENWRATYGSINTRLKDQELILRFFALYCNAQNYKRPMKDFLSKFSKRIVVQAQKA